MPTRPIAPNEISVGRPLPWAIHDRTGKLLLRQGEIIKSEDLLNAVLERGLVQELESSREFEDIVPIREIDIRKLPVFRRIRAMQDAVERITIMIRGERVAGVSACTELASTLRDACDSDLDAALAAFQVDAAEETVGGMARSVHCAVLCELISRSLKLDAATREAIICAAFTHDIGMQPLGDALNRQRVALSDEQRQALSGHTELGCSMLRRVGVKEPVWLQAVHEHHERIDGSGYPSGLAGDQICLAARIVAISDIYSAMIRPRAYRQAIQSREALRQLFLERGRWVDESMAALFIREIGVYPPGTLVRLGNNEVAMVTRRGETAAAPKLRAVVAANGQPVLRASERDTQLAGNNIVGVVPIDRYRSLLGRMPELWEERNG